MATSSDLEPIDSDRAVRERYGAAARAREAALCCPVDYDPRYLEAIPAEVIERDYGCGDPSRYVDEGDTVLDLGSGGGKIAFIASQLVGAQGRVIGVDVNEEMLALARGAAPGLAERVGYANVDFRRGRIEDLGLDLDALDVWLASNSVEDSAALAGLKAEQRRLRADAPMIPSDSIDIVVSNCVLNLVREEANQAIVYAGPWKRVEDDDGHVFERGVRSAVCAKTFAIMRRAPYADETIGIEPHAAVPEAERSRFDCARRAPRHPRETKGQDARRTRLPSGGDGCC